jgi:uncharacterized phage protein (TIGR01671 family)
MREIKFRVWDQLLMVMERALVVYFNNQEVYFIHKGSSQLRGLGNIVLMQFTGLLDKNGKEIYEGDIVRVQSQYETDEPIDSAPNKVYFRDGAFRCGFHNMLLGENVCTGKEGNWNMEVIGNIYENLELLEKKS